MDKRLFILQLVTTIIYLVVFFDELTPRTISLNSTIGWDNDITLFSFQVYLGLITILFALIVSTVAMVLQQRIRYGPATAFVVLTVMFTVFQYNFWMPYNLYILALLMLLSLWALIQVAFLERKI